jgi:hypothetical protein
MELTNKIDLLRNDIERGYEVEIIRISNRLLNIKKDVENIQSYAYVIQHKETMRILGSFKTKTSADKYVSNNENLQILKLELL